MADLWPDTDVTPIPGEAPATELRIQAKYLSDKTGGVLSCYLKTVNPNEDAANMDDGEFIYDFFLVAPKLEYDVRLLRMRYPAAFYPLTVQATTSVTAELSAALNAWVLAVEGYPTKFLIQNDVDLAVMLEAIFGATETLALLRSVIMQSETAP